MGRNREEGEIEAEDLAYLSNYRARRKLFKEEYAPVKEGKDRRKGIKLSAELNGNWYKGNIDLDKRKPLEVDGNILTENSITVGFDGNNVIIPTIVNGKQLSNDDAIAHYKNTGEHLGMYDDPIKAEEVANLIHQRQKKKYIPNSTKVGDYARSTMMGFTNLYDTAGYGIGEFGEAVGSEGLQDFGEMMREEAQFATKFWEGGMSDRAKELMKKTFLVEKNGRISYEESILNIIKNPAKAGLAITQSLPATGAGMALGGLFAKGFSLIPGIGGSVASAMGFGLGEGAISALDTGKDTEDKVLAMPISQLEKHPEFQIALYATNGNKEEARKLVADGAGGDARALTMLTTTIFSSPVGLIFEPLFIGNQAIASTFFKSWALGALGETGQEVPQSGFERFWSNYAVQKNADESQKLFEGVPEAITQALVTAPVLGGGFGGLSTQAQNTQAITQRGSDALMDKVGDLVSQYYDSRYGAVPKMFVPAYEDEQGAVADMYDQNVKKWLSNENAKIDLSKLIKPLNKIEGLLKRKYNYLENKVANREIDPFDADETMKNYLLELKDKYLESAKLEEVLDFPELYEREPWTKDIKVTFDPQMDGSSAYSPITKEIVLGEEDLGALLHETQHTIQDKYEWAGGGSANDINPESLIETLNILAGEHALPIWDELDARREEGTIEAKEYYETYINEGIQHLRGGLPELEYHTYRRIGGEQEARVNQASLKHPDMLPWEALAVEEGRIMKPLIHIGGKIKSFNERFNGKNNIEATVKMASEALPSTSRVEGKIIKDMSLEAQTEYHRGVQSIVTDEFGVDWAIKEAGLVELDTVEAPSHYEHHIGVSEQTDIGGFTTLDEDTIKRLRFASALKGYIQDQDAVVLRYLVPAKSESEINSAMMDIGRVLTDAEMRAVSSAIESNGFNPEHIALPTSDYGLDVLDVSFGDMSLDDFKKVVDIIGNILPNTEVSFANNLLLNDGYVGGFDGWQSGNQAYKEIIDEGSRLYTRQTEEGEQGQSYYDVLNQKRDEVRNFTREFIKRERNRNGGSKTIADIGRESDQEVAEAGEKFEINDRSSEAESVITDKMYNKALDILKGGDKQAIGWYTTKFQETMDKLSEKIPELKDPTNRKLFSAITAVTSDGTDLYKNLDNAIYTFREYLKDNSVVHEAPNPRQISHKKNLQKLQDIIDEKGLENALDWLNEESLVKDIEKMTGKPITGLGKNDYYPNSVMLGPKVGMFYSNLTGDPNNLTMDRWWTRMFNRLRGTASQRPTKAQYDRFKKALGRQRMSEAKMDKVADEIVKRWAKSDRGLTKGTELELSANQIVKANTELVMRPSGVNDRNFQMRVAQNVVDRLRANGYPDITLADLQATLWYGEKRAMFARGSNVIVELDFFDALNKMIAEKNGVWKNIKRAEDITKKADRFYSQLKKVLDESKQRKYTVAQLRGYLAKNGVKKEEMKWSGVADLLDSLGEDTVVSLDSIEVEQPVLVEKTLSDEKKRGRYTAPELLDIMPIFDAYMDTGGYADLVEALKGNYEVEKAMKEQYGDDFDPKSDWEEDVASVLLKGTENEEAPKYKGYATRGGENYREVLTTFNPNQSEEARYKENKKRASDLSNQYWNEDGSVNQAVKEELDEIKAEIKSYEDNPSTRRPYKSAHYDVDNLLMHRRVQDVEIGGEKAMLIDELQSDWHQAGREKGYKPSEGEAKALIDRTDEITKEIHDVITRANNDLGENKESGFTNWKDKYKKEYEALNTEMDEVLAKRKLIGQGVPQAPYQKSEDWAMKMIKDSIAEAVDNGYKKIAWTTGKAQADRYSLAKVYDDVRVVLQSNGKYAVHAKRTSNTGFDMIGNHLSEEEVAGYIGKELAEKAINNLNDTNRMIDFSGQSLEVGGEGQKAFYDKMLPKWVDKYIAKYGSNVEKAKLSDGQEVWTFEINDNMAEAIERTGQTLYTNPLRVPEFFLFDIPEYGAKLIRGANKIVSKITFGNLKDTWLDNMLRKNLFSKAGGLGSLTRSQEASFVKAYREMKSAKGTATLNAEDKAELVDQASAKLEDELINATIIQYLENPEARADIANDYPELAEPLDEIRKSIDAISQELMERGLITQSQYDKWEGKYLSRVYATYAREGKFKGKGKSGIKMEDIKAGRRIDSLIDYLNEYPDEADRLMPLVDAKQLVKLTIGKAQSNLGLDDFFRSILERSELVDGDMLVSLPEQVEKLPAVFSPAYAKEVVIPYLDDLNLEYKRGEVDADARAREAKRAGNEELYKEILAEKEDWIEKQSYYNDMIKDIRTQAKEAEENIKYSDNKSLATLPKDRRYGVLSGMKINKDVASLVESSFVMAVEPETLVEKSDHLGRKLLTYFKWSKVPANIYSYPRNFQSNFWQWTLSGANPTHFFKEYPHMALDWFTHGKWWRIAMKAGILDSNLISAEIGNSLDVIKGNLSDDSKIQKVMAVIMEKTGDAYGAIDDIAKMARMKYAIEQEGQTLMEAVETAQNTHYDYSLTDAIIRAMRDPDMTVGTLLKLVGTLFPTYTQKTIAFTYDTLIERPVTLALVSYALYALIHGDEDEQRRRIGAKEYDTIRKTDPEWIKNNPLIKVDVEKDRRTGQTKVVYTDISYVFPTGNLIGFYGKITAGEVAGAFEELGLGGSPMQMLANLRNNMDAFTGKKVYFEHDWWEKTKDVTQYLAKQFAPATITKTMNLMETRHPWKIRLSGINSYEYTADELATWNEYRAREMAMEAGKEAVKYKRKIQQADRDLVEGKISRLEHRRIVNDNKAEIEHWKNLGEKLYQETSIRSTPYKKYNAIAKKVKSAVRELRDAKKEAQRANGNKEPYQRMMKDREMTRLINKYERVKQIDREIRKIKKMRTELEGRKMSDEQREKAYKKLDERMDTIYRRGYKLLR